MSEQPEALESEIQQLEQELAKKRAELGSDSAAPYERGEVHAQVTEKIRQSVPAYQSAATTGVNTPSYQDPALAAAVQALVDVAFSQSIQAAIDQASKADNPALMDALHDVLVDQLHQELLNRQKLQPAP